MPEYILNKAGVHVDKVCIVGDEDARLGRV